MAGIFPGAPDLATFWDNLVGGVDAVSDVPPDRVDPVFFEPRPTGPDRFYCRRGGFIDSTVPFDPSDFGIMPVAAAGTVTPVGQAVDAARSCVLVIDGARPSGRPIGAPGDVFVAVAAVDP